MMSISPSDCHFLKNTFNLHNLFVTASAFHIHICVRFSEKNFPLIIENSEAFQPDLFCAVVYNFTSNNTFHIATYIYQRTGHFRGNVVTNFLGFDKNM